MLLINQSGNNVDIHTLGTKAEINVTGSIADVLVEGYTWNVNFVSGTFAPLTIADVEFYPVLSGGSCQTGDGDRCQSGIRCRWRQRLPAQCGQDHGGYRGPAPQLLKSKNITGEFRAVPYRLRRGFLINDV